MSLLVLVISAVVAKKAFERNGHVGYPFGELPVESAVIDEVTPGHAGLLAGAEVPEGEEREDELYGIAVQVLNLRP